MRNQPKYDLFKNTGYALSGLKDIMKNETSFKLEIIIFFFLIIILYIINISLLCKIIMFTSLSIILIAEVINSAIERVVDLVTLEHNEMAGRAKDIGSTAVFLSIVVAIVVWLSILINEFL